MAEDTLWLIIDGNNLAHAAYVLPPGHKVDAATDRRLVDHLVGWRAAHPVRLDLALDGAPGDLQPPEFLRIFPRVHPERADDRVRERFRFHQHAGERCLVVTNDLEILEAVESEGGDTLPVSSFVAAPSTTRPRFISFHHLAALLRTTPRPRKHPAAARGQDAPTAPPAPPHSLSPLRPRPPRPPRTEPPPSPIPLPPPEPAYEPPPSAIPPPAGPRWSASPLTWPPARGLKFLSDSFCPAHRPDDLLALVTPDDVTPQDLVGLAVLLVERCGAEPGFSRHGSLMDRIRLTLLRAGPAGLTLAELETHLGRPTPGLRRTLIEKGEGWVECDAVTRGG